MKVPKIRASLLFAASATFCLGGITRGSVVEVARYHLGESDTSVQGNTPPLPGDTAVTTVDSVGGLNLTASDTNVQYVAASNPGTGNTDTLAAKFTAGDNFSSSATVGTSATDDFGVEAYVSTNNANQRAVAFFGNAGANGYGIYVLNGKYTVAYGGVEFFTGPAVDTSGAFHDVAAVRSGGTAYLYIDGVSQTLTPAFNPTSPLTVTPNAPGSGISINSDNSKGGQATVDEARLFTFTGAFNTGDLYASVPEPASTALLGMASIGLIVRRRRE